MSLKKYHLHVIVAFFFFIHLFSNGVLAEKEKAPASVVQPESSSVLEAPTEEMPKTTITVILEPYQKVEVYPEAFEEVELIPFKLGESFKRGDLLLKMRNKFYVSQLKKNLKALEFATEDLRIKDSLRKSNLISTLELLQSQLSLATAEAAVSEADRSYQTTLVFAPFDGKIGSIHIRENERPLRQKSMMEIFNDQRMIARFIIPSNLLHRFTLGQILPVFVRDLNKTFSAKLIRIGAEINPVSLTVNLEAEIDNLEGSLMPGMASVIELNETSFLNNETGSTVSPSTPSLSFVPFVLGTTGLCETNAGFASSFHPGLHANVAFLIPYQTQVSGATGICNPNLRAGMSPRPPLLNCFRD